MVAATEWLAAFGGEMNAARHVSQQSGERRGVRNGKMEGNNGVAGKRGIMNDNSPPNWLQVVC